MSNSARILTVGNFGLLILALLWAYYASHCTWVDGEVWADHGDDWAETTEFLGLFNVFAWFVLAILTGFMVLKRVASWKYLIPTLLLGFILGTEWFFSSYSIYNLF
jgi:hypothetical protein